MPHALSLIFFSSFSLFLFIFRSLHFSIIFHLSLLLFPLDNLFLLISLKHINLLTIDPWVPILHFHIFSFSLGFISGFNNHLINIHLTIPRKIPKLAQLYSEYIIIFILKIIGYFWGVTVNLTSDSLDMHKYCKTRENFNFLKNGKIVISVKIKIFSRSWMTKWTSPLESSREI